MWNEALNKQSGTEMIVEPDQLVPYFIKAGADNAMLPSPTQPLVNEKFNVESMNLNNDFNSKMVDSTIVINEDDIIHRLSPRRETPLGDMLQRLQKLAPEPHHVHLLSYYMHEVVGLISFSATNCVVVATVEGLVLAITLSLVFSKSWTKAVDDWKEWNKWIRQQGRLGIHQDKIWHSWCMVWSITLTSLSKAKTCWLYLFMACDSWNFPLGEELGEFTNHMVRSYVCLIKGVFNMQSCSSLRLRLPLQLFATFEVYPQPKNFKKHGALVDLFDFLQHCFGFQDANVANQREHLILLLANMQTRQTHNKTSVMKLGEGGVDELMRKFFKIYTTWCKFLERKSNIRMSLLYLSQYVI
ncbi:hypothetical protein P8452_76369 [Trifolium repens]|nr:hypothetical protein P8452_76369 [Trifolium repens]